MKRFAFLGLAAGLAACSSSDDLKEAEIGVSQITATVEYDADTGNYIVTPVGGTPEVYTVDNTLDILGFEFAESATFGFLLSRAEDGTRATLLVESLIDESSAAVLLSRSVEGELPDANDVTYDGDYLGVLFLDGSWEGSIIGVANVNVNLDDQRAVVGSITDRILVTGVVDPLTIPDVTLKEGELSRTGGLIEDAVASFGDPTNGDSFFYDGAIYTSTSGSYSGMISGENGEYFIGGVELIYEGDTGTTATTTGREIGAIFTDIVVLP